ncbi:MAG: UDP-N-acetylmuramoyl-L-alanyl-D-glutamate--2,6-diaminopimelate ligase [Rhodospirillaceae bacterium]
MRLIELLDGDLGSGMNAAAFDDYAVTGVTCDSRQVHPGYVFAAIPGTQTDGCRFIADAIGRGAIAVLAPPGTALTPPTPDIALVTDDNPRRRYALLAARYYAPQPETVVGVTGTNGKTSVVSFLRQIWTASGRKCASAGTLGTVLGGFAAGAEPTLTQAISLTTPDPADLHRCLAELAANGIDSLALEASSHGLDQFRLDGVRMAAAAFTNLTRDHLDYHGDMAGYLAAKRRLFAEILAADGTAVINADDPHADAFIAAALALGVAVLTCGRAGAEVVLHDQAPDAGGQRLDISIFGERHVVRLPLPGAFQGANALVALGLALATGVAPADAVTALGALRGVRGRIERVGAHASGAEIFVDYAHTPDALRNVLETLRPHATGALHVVLGCGGDRDPGKRPEMGRAAADVADYVIVTDDNPRTEDAAAIRRAAMAGCPDALEIGDRAAAIAAAIERLQAGDILVVAGKGHETGQIVGTEVRPFDDAEVVRTILGGGAS